MDGLDSVPMPDPKRILIVDDNTQYRAAVTRNLTLAGYQVLEAEDADEGMQIIQSGDPHVIITDLDMRTHDEGLQFIREVKRRYPKMPIVMISAVGTFDEGALARQYGATFVLSKSRIDSEIESLYQRLDRVFGYFRILRRLHARLDEILAAESADTTAFQQELNALLQDQELDAGLKSEVYEISDRLERLQAPSPSVQQDWDLEATLARLLADYPEIRGLDQETKTMLAIAERMQQSAPGTPRSMERNVGFSYSFAVENEVKLRIGKKVNRLLASDQAKKLAFDLYDPSLNNLDIFFGQYLIRTVQQHNMELNADITRQVVERIIQHGAKYKPDGLKALGVILFCWGRNHSFQNRKGKLEVRNPLSIKGLSDEGVTKLADQLILLQHLRNPFIHPEFSEREKTESVRKTTLTCISLISQVV